MKSSWSKTTDEVRSKLDVDLERGLSEEDARRRRDEHGPNRLREVETRRWYQIVIDQLRSLIVGLLFVAAVAAFGFGELVEGTAILVVIVLNTLIGFLTELRAVRSMESLRELGGVNAYALRDGELVELPADDLVPGDIIKLSEGDLVTADVRLVSENNLQVDESALTGESVAVEKSDEPVEENTPIAERTSMAFKGTVITRGEAMGIVVSTGMDTELGEITSLVEQAESETTPLEKRLESLGNKLVWLTLLIAGLVSLSGILAGRKVLLMIETGIALAVAAVPEGLPVVATLALARGMWRMADRNALINKLSAVETLGSTTMIMTDKTGTLTENEMTVRTMFIHSIPEGVAVGVGFASGEYELGVLIALAIAIHNIPEGLAISIPLSEEGSSFWQCAWYSFLSSVPQPVAAVPAAALVVVFEALLPFSLGFASGAMLLLVMTELVPESIETVGKMKSGWAFLIGFVVMMGAKYVI